MASNPTKGSNAAPDSLIDRATSLKYWNEMPATSSGMLAMLGEYPWYTRIDLRGNKTFLNKLSRVSPSCSAFKTKVKRGADCGAGVGRVTEGFLREACEVVDVVEPVDKFTRVLHEGPLKRDGVVGDIYTVGLEDWAPEREYDLIWMQFCVGHLTDRQLVGCVGRCRDALTQGGIVVVKENMSTNPDRTDMYDEVDSSVTRTDEKFRTIFREAGMELISTELQLGFPKEFKLLPVRFYALRPSK